MAREKSIVILQSNYIPWKGYFDLLASADEFLIYDEVQFTKNDWRNRNRIPLNGKLHWLTLPVKTAGLFGAAIDQVEVSNPNWSRSHWETLRQAYRGAPYYRAMGPLFEAGYQECGSLTRLSEINERFLRLIAGALALDTQVLRADTVPRVAQDPTQRLIEICHARGARSYISGPSARSYLDIEALTEAGISLLYCNYRDYPTYNQACEPFEHGVSMIDVLMQCGHDARFHLKSLRDRASFLEPQSVSRPA